MLTALLIAIAAILGAFALILLIWERSGNKADSAGESPYDLANPYGKQQRARRRKRGIGLVSILLLTATIWLFGEPEPITVMLAIIRKYLPLTILCVAAALYLLPEIIAERMANKFTRLIYFSPLKKEKK